MPPPRHIDVPVGHVDVHVDTPHVDVPVHIDVPALHVDVPAHVDAPAPHLDVPAHVDVPAPHLDVPVHLDVPLHVDAPWAHVDASHVDLSGIPDPAAVAAAIMSLVQRVDALGPPMLQMQSLLASMQQAMNMATGAAVHAANGTLPTLVGLQSTMNALLRQYSELTDAIRHDGSLMRSRYELVAKQMQEANESARVALETARDGLRERIRSARDGLMLPIVSIEFRLDG